MKLRDRLKKLYPNKIQWILMTTFTVVSVSIMLILGVTLYVRFSGVFQGATIASTEQLMEQSATNLETYLSNMRQISDAIYYDTIREVDISSQNIGKEMNLLYEANKNNLVSIALYDRSGRLIAAEPIAQEKDNADVTSQSWFSLAISQPENLHFSTPHVQSLFDDTTDRYYWVISLSRSVDLTDGGVPKTGVLLVDMNYYTIMQMMTENNSLRTGQYYYLSDSDGKIIYHPHLMEIMSGKYEENSTAAAQYADGVYDETFLGIHRKVVVRTIGYTGWKLVSVIPYSTFSLGTLNIRYFVILVILLIAMTLMLVNRLIARRVSLPITRLNESVKAYEAGEKPSIYIGGSDEVRHLGHSIQASYEKIDDLMADIVRQQEEKRRNEIAALQSQINPHFLYNTLDSITWMIEGGKNDDAVYMISQLAKLLRISLSKGRNIISVQDEFRHAESYMNIQKVRYKDTFTVSFDLPDDVAQCCTIKLIIQPILENAIYYGVEGMDGDGEIIVKATRDGQDVSISISDNGTGMPEETAAMVLTDSNHVHKHGSGVGLVNVNNRIRLLFGEQYGLTVKSEPDEGTTVTIHIPAIPFTEENRVALESGKLPEMPAAPASQTEISEHEAESGSINRDKSEAMRSEGGNQ